MRKRRKTKEERARLKRKEESLQRLLSFPAVDQGPLVGRRIDCKHDQGFSVYLYCVGCGASAAWVVMNGGTLGRAERTGE